MKNQGIIIKNTKKVKLSNTLIENNKIELIAQQQQTEETEIINQGYLIEEVESLEVSEATSKNNLITETKKRKRKSSQEESQENSVIAMEIDEHSETNPSQTHQFQTENNYLHSQLGKIEELTQQEVKKEPVSQQGLNAYWDNLKTKAVKGEEAEKEAQIIYNLPKSD